MGLRDNGDGTMTYLAGPPFVNWRLRAEAAEAECARLKATIPEGCTPADAQMLRKANHALAVDLYEAQSLIRDLAPEGIEQACDECGGDDNECSSTCDIRRARAYIKRLDAIDAAMASAQSSDRAGQDAPPAPSGSS